eukprot:SAG31_NODE_28827_length_404_cov_2.452459_1_plen_45_part_10
MYQILDSTKFTYLAMLSPGGLWAMLFRTAYAAAARASRAGAAIAR